MRQASQTHWGILCSLPVLVMVGILSFGTLVTADEETKKPATLELADGKLTLVLPEKWERKPPASRIVDHEFAAPAVEGDPAEARITVMGAGGGIQANVDRWIGQFEQPDGSDSRDKTKVEKKRISDTDVYVVSVTGNYKDRPGGGPFTQTPVVVREDYRMLSAIVATERQGHYFIKMYGPRKTVDAQEEAFAEMVASLKAP